MTENELSHTIIGCALKVHSTLGPGLLESAYEECLFWELMQLKIKVEKQKPVPLIYNDKKLEIGYRLDLMVDNKIIVEIKSVDGFSDIHFAQILTYLKLTKCKIGLLLNFNVTSLKNGIKRMVL